MFCRNCGNNLNDKAYFCGKCGTKKNEFNNLNSKSKNSPKKINVLFIVVSIIYLIIFIIDLFFVKKYLNDSSSMSGLWEIFALFITGLPYFVLIILSIINISTLSKYKKEKNMSSTRVTVLSLFNIFYIISLPILFILAEQIKSNNNNMKIEQKLDELYGTSYKVLDTCSYSNAGGSYYVEYVVKVSGFEYPVLAHFDISENLYEDNYDELVKTQKLNYQQYINSVFGTKTIALMNLVGDDEYNRIDLNILMTNDNLKNKELLKSNIHQIINTYTSQFIKSKFNLSIYFTEKIDNSKVEEYYKFLTKNFNECRKNFIKKINNYSLKVISVSKKEDVDMLNEIEEAVENATYISDY